MSFLAENNFEIVAVCEFCILINVQNMPLKGNFNVMTNLNLLENYLGSTLSLGFSIFFFLKFLITLV